MKSVKPLKILLSAYACEPGKGSEPGVGWNWALSLARRGHQVWVLTRSNNRAAIEQAVAEGKQPELVKLNWLYYDVPKWASWWKKGGRGVHLYYFLWQWGAYLFAKKIHQSVVFELVHHVTFVSVRQPSFMGNLGIPFIFGPVAGGESAPIALRDKFGLRGQLIDGARDIANALVRIGPFMHMTFSQAFKIYVTSEQTRQLIPERYQNRVTEQLAIALDCEFIEVSESQSGGVEDKNLRLVYIGHFLYLKGMHMGLVAFARLLQRYSGARLTMVGKGPDERNWKSLAKKIGVDRNIDWLSWVKQSELGDIYRKHNVMLFPSLHDSGGMVVLEAMSHGLPVVCLKLGGPGVLVDNTCGRAVDVAGDDYEAATAKLADALLELAASQELRNTLSEGARRKAERSTWDATTAAIYDVIEADLNKATELKINSQNG